MGGSKMIKLKNILKEKTYKTTISKSSNWVVYNMSDALKIIPLKIVKSEKEALKLKASYQQRDKLGAYGAVPVKDWNKSPNTGKKLKEGKLTERRAQEARSWSQAVKLSRKGAGRKLQYKDKNGNPIYGNTMFYFQKVLHQVYPDDERSAYVAYNKKRNKVRSLNNYFTSDWKKIEIATG